MEDSNVTCDCDCHHMRLKKVDDVKSGFRVGSYRFLGRDFRSFLRENLKEEFSLEKTGVDQ